MFTQIKRQDWTPRQYHAYKAVSNSTLSRMHKDPTTTHEKIEPNESMKIGSAFDDYLLLPDTFYDKWRVLEVTDSPSGENQTMFCRLVMGGVSPVDALARSYKKPTMSAEEMMQKFGMWMELQTNENALSTDQFNTLKWMKKSVAAHKGAVELIERSEKQVCFTGIHEETGLEVKGMLDMWVPGESLEVDLKTTSTHWHKINRYWMRDRGYDMQRAMYCGLSGATSTGLLAVSTMGRHRVGLIDCTYNMETEAWARRLDLLLKEYKYRLDNDAWLHPVDYYNGNYWEELR